MTDMQRNWYKSVLQKDVDAVQGQMITHLVAPKTHPLPGLTGKKEGKTRLMNIVMQLRKGEYDAYDEVAY